VKRFGPALAERDFSLLWLALLAMGVSVQMLEVAIGWEVYTNQRSALDLGLIGLAEFIPMFALALPAGQLADHLPRRLILMLSLLLSAAVAAGLAIVSSSGVTGVWPFLAPGRPRRSARPPPARYRQRSFRARCWRAR
jgi:MFS family permease